MLLSAIIIALVIGTALYAARQTNRSLIEDDVSVAIPTVDLNAAENTPLPIADAALETPTVIVTAEFVQIEEATPASILTPTDVAADEQIITRVTITPSKTPTQTATATFTATATATETQTPTPTETPTATVTPTATPTFTATPTPTLGPTQDAAASGRQIRVPILMYHHVGPLPEDADALRIGLTVVPEMFRLQLEYLRDNGYEPISLYELQYALTQGREIPEKPVIFTFDDGYRNNYEYAYPIMQEFGWTGALFLVTEFMDEGREEYLTWDMALEMHAAGWDLEPHTKTHASLTDHNKDYVVYEVLGSMQTLEHYLGYQPRFFVYPYGAYNDDVVDIIRDVGFWGALTTKRGLTQTIHYPLERGRIRVDGKDTMQDFANRLGVLPSDEESEDAP